MVVVISGTAETRHSLPGTRLTASIKTSARSACPKSDLLLKHHCVLVYFLTYCMVHSKISILEDLICLTWLVTTINRQESFIFAQQIDIFKYLVSP